MKKFIITRSVPSSLTNTPATYERVSLPFGLRISWDNFEILVKASDDIRQGSHKTWNKWVSNSLSRIVDFYQMRDILNMDLMRNRIKYLNSKLHLGLESNNRIQFMNFGYTDGTSYMFRNASSSLGVFPPILIDVQDHQESSKTDLYWLVSMGFSQMAYNYIMEQKDGRIYHRPYPVSTWIIVTRLHSSKVIEALKPGMYTELHTSDYREEIEKISFI